ncbi:insulinase family protein [Stappia sp. F7233]|uniref:Insulinase family protein n=1 Tax=Stappia albiluteola TaxID=2758565 RepID=A0A839AH38_9HYPH|nr:insulinase family protein [Stappia albiluteola]
MALAVLLASQAAPSVANAETQAAATSSDFADIRVGGDVSSFTLENGLQVVVIPDHRAPVVTHMIWYKVGSADELPGKSGIAHFLEHLMFKGTKNHPEGAFSKRVAEIGGSENAFTSNDYTAYFQKISKDYLPEMMAFEADRMQNLVLTDEVVAPEREVVLEERRQRIDNDPSSKLSETLDSILYVNHPYSVPVIGWKDEIRALNKEDAFAFYDRYYTPNNAVLVVAGDVTPEEVRANAEATYGKLQRRAEPGERTRPKTQTPPGAREVTLVDEQVNQPILRQAWLVPSYTVAEGNEGASLDVLAQILGGGATSRLYRELVVEGGIASSAGSWYQSTALDDTRFMIYGVPRDGKDLNDVSAAIRATVDDIIENGVGEEELERAKKGMLAEAVYAQDSQSTLARIFGAALTTGGTIESVQQWPRQIASVTARDVQEVARKYLSDAPVTANLLGSPPPAASEAAGKSGKKS